MSKIRVLKKHVSPAGDNFYSVTDRRMGWQTIDKMIPESLPATQATNRRPSAQVNKRAKS